MLAALSVLLASPAFAIQKKKDSGSQSKAGAQVQNKSSESGEKSVNVTPSAPEETPKDSDWKPAKEIKKDNFVDDDGDGLNDSIKKQPTVKIIKKEKPPEQPKPSEPEKKSKHQRR